MTLLLAPKSRCLSRYHRYQTIKVIIKNNRNLHIEGFSDTYKVDKDLKPSLYQPGRNIVIFWHVSCYCVVVRMHHNKDTQKEVIIIEAVM